MKPNNFNLIAKYYDMFGYVVFGNVLKKAQLSFMDTLPTMAEVLVVGDGNGWVLYNLLKVNKCKKIVTIESSTEMVKITQNRITSLSYQAEVVFVTSTIQESSLNDKFDVVVTNFFLDVFEEPNLRTVMNKLAKSMKPDGIWLVTDFRISQHRFHKHWQQLLIQLMYKFFKVFSNLEANRLLSFPPYFATLGLKKRGSKHYFWGMIESSIYAINEGSFQDLEPSQKTLYK